MKRLLVIVALALAACGQPQQEEADSGASLAPVPQFRNDPNLIAAPLEPIAASATGYGTQFIAAIAPDAHGLRYEEGPSGQVQTVVAPAATTLTMDIPEGTAELVIAYGMSPPSYTNNGTTKGVCFAVDTVGESGVTGQPWRECLRPVENAADRGMHEVSVNLPAGTERVNLQTSAAAENGDVGWGWAYWALPRTGPGSAPAPQ